MITLTETTPPSPTSWAVVVNDMVTRGPFTFDEAEAFRLAVLAVPEVTDVVVRPVLDDDVFAC